MRRDELQTMRRVFEDALTMVTATYAPDQDAMVDACAPNAAGVFVVVARYKLYRDGRWQCFEILDDVLWPELEEGRRLEVEGYRGERGAFSEP